MAVLDLEPVETSGCVAHQPDRRHQPRDTAEDPEGPGHLVAGYQDVEGRQGPGIRREDGAGTRPLRQPARGWARGLCRRVRATQPATACRARLASQTKAEADRKSTR